MRARTRTEDEDADGEQVAFWDCNDTVLLVLSLLDAVVEARLLEEGTGGEAGEGGERGREEEDEGDAREKKRDGDGGWGTGRRGTALK